MKYAYRIYNRRGRLIADGTCQYHGGGQALRRFLSAHYLCQLSNVEVLPA